MKNASQKSSTERNTSLDIEEIKPYSRKNSPAFWQAKLSELYSHPQSPEELIVKVHLLLQHPSYQVLQDKEKERVQGYQDCLREELFKKLSWFQIMQASSNRPGIATPPPPPAPASEPVRPRRRNVS